MHTCIHAYAYTHTYTYTHTHIHTHTHTHTAHHISQNVDAFVALQGKADRSTLLAEQVPSHQVHALPLHRFTIDGYQLVAFLYQPATFSRRVAQNGHHNVRPAHHIASELETDPGPLPRIVGLPLLSLHWRARQKGDCELIACVACWTSPPAIFVSLVWLRHCCAARDVDLCAFWSVYMHVCVAHITLAWNDMFSGTPSSTHYACVCARTHASL